jgi:glycosyltransferase involved in cell wall biosynthesis
VNFGIWNAAIAPSTVLEESYGIKSECWYPADERNGRLPEGIKGVEINSRNISELQKLIIQEGLYPSNTLIMTHGAWQYPTRWGYEFARLGFRWWYVPHGMLEPWSMSQKRNKKYIYFNLIEKRLIKKAEVIRAVGKPEQFNLSQLTGREILLIPNGVPDTFTQAQKTFNFPRKYLFMSRLHHKKGVIPLMNAWISSSLNQNTAFELIIVGPDDGEGEKLQQILNTQKKGNIRYIGAVYGEEKKVLLESCHFFILPSQSEGFPTSVVEAMQQGLIPLISKGCNFPEALEAGMALETGTNEKEIIKALEQSIIISESALDDLSSKLRTFVEERYALSVIGKKMADAFR